MPNFRSFLSSNPNLLHRVFSRLLSLDDHQRANIEDDWEFIEFLDREFAWGDDVEMVDQEESECSSFTSLEHNKKMKYTILSKADVRQRLENKITKVASVLLLSKNEAAILLQHFKWTVNRTNDEWLACEEKVRRAVGLFRPVSETPANAAQIACRKCHVDFPSYLMYSVSCGHQICHSCWKEYISEAINDGPRCLTLRCPEQSCDAAVGLYLIELLSSKDDKEKFENHLLRSYLARNRKAKWCPAPNCNYAVLFCYCGEGNVTCQCLHSFCWSCSREAHEPVDCGTLTEWTSQSVIQSENWVLANTITCQDCKSPFELASSSKYVICPVCEFQFCRLCGDDSLAWEHNCTGYVDAFIEPVKNPLERYNDYYEGWATCGSSREKALTSLKQLQNGELDLLSGIFGISPEVLGFLVEALLQVAECWQVLKYTHVYGYFLPENENAKKQLFEYLQEYATSLVMELYKLVEELQEMLYAKVPYIEYVESRKKIVTLTRVSKNYFDKLVEGLKAGLPEVDCIPELSPMVEVPREEGENDCSWNSPNENPFSSPIVKVMRGVGDFNISSPVGTPKSDDSWTTISEPVHPNFEPKND
ncbi:hypothetical protein BVRB_3g066450 [Beta vulgaris subsp. vulgaris]|nr:hypothetical protein BVRB_3g066450 [Beta vulgaris subsp. vulgaris]